MNQPVPETEQARLSRVQQMVEQAVRVAEFYGMTVTITNEPMKPLSMGNTRHAVSVRPARGSY